MHPPHAGTSMVYCSVHRDAKAGHVANTNPCGDTQTAKVESVPSASSCRGRICCGDFVANAKTYHGGTITTRARCGTEAESAANAESVAEMKDVASAEPVAKTASAARVQYVANANSVAKTEWVAHAGSVAQTR